jgi:hypothetical protein
MEDYWVCSAFLAEAVELLERAIPCIRYENGELALKVVEYLSLYKEQLGNG